MENYEIEEIWSRKRMKTCEDGKRKLTIRKSPPVYRWSVQSEWRSVVRSFQLVRNNDLGVSKHSTDWQRDGVRFILHLLAMLGKMLLQKSLNGNKWAGDYQSVSLNDACLINWQPLAQIRDESFKEIDPISNRKLRWVKEWEKNLNKKCSVQFLTHPFLREHEGDRIEVIYF